MRFEVDHVGWTVRDALALAAAAEGRLDVPVLGCPGWDVGDLVWHLREVHWFWTAIVEELLTEPPGRPLRPRRPADPQCLLSEFRAGIDHLERVFRSADPAAPCWTWSSQHDVAFVIRHQAQEAAVHRWDAQQAAGAPEPIDPLLAADAVDEFLTFPYAPDPEGGVRPVGPVRLEAGDVPAAWTVRRDEFGALRAVPEAGSAEPEPLATVRGTASDLLLALFRRLDARQLAVTGSADAWLALLDRDDRG